MAYINPTAGAARASSGVGTSGIATGAITTGKLATNSVTTAKLDPTTIQTVEVALTNAEIKALRATPKTLVAAPGAGKLLEFVAATLILDAGTNALTESTANLAVKYKDGSGTQISETVESTGFIDQTADTMTTCRVKQDGIVAKTVCENQPLVLHNLGAGEIAGNAAADALLRVKVAYRVWPSGW